MYTLPPPSGFLPTDLRDQMRRWLRSHRSVGAIERPGEWLLFADSAMQAAVQRPLDRVPNAPQYGHASIWLRDDAVDLETAREPETDRAQHAFTLWAQQQAPLIPKDSGIRHQSLEAGMADSLGVETQVSIPSRRGFGVTAWLRP